MNSLVVLDIIGATILLAGAVIVTINSRGSNMSRLDDDVRAVRSEVNWFLKQSSNLGTLIVGVTLISLTFLLGHLFSPAAPKPTLDRTSRQAIYEYCLDKTSEGWSHTSWSEEARMNDCIHYLTFAEPKE